MPYLYREIACRVEAVESFPYEERQEVYRAYEELVHHDDLAGVGAGEAFGEGGMAYLAEYGDEQEHYAPDEVFSYFAFSHRYHHDADERHEDADDVDGVDLFLEEEQACADGEDRYGRDDHRAEGRGAGLLEAHGLADEVDEGLAEGQQEEFRQVASLYPLDAGAGRVEEEKDDAGQEYPDEDEVEHGDVLVDELVCPEV